MRCLTEDAAMDWLHEAAAVVPADEAIVELGVYQGCSLDALARGAAQGNGAEVFGIDPWGLPGPGERYNRLRRGYGPQNMRIAQARVGRRATLVRDFSTSAASTWVKPVGLLFVDAVHEYDTVMADLRAWAPLLAPNAVVALDDCHDRFPGVLRAAQEVDPGYTTVGTRLAVLGAGRTL